MTSTHIKKILFGSLFSISLCGFDLRLASAATTAPTELYVQVRGTALRASPLMWAGAVANLAYGDKLDVVDASKADTGWFKVKTAKGANGFVHQSAVSQKEIVLSGKSKAGVEADPSEVILAGKGFSKEVEEEFAKSRSLNFSEVNRLERVRTSAREMRDFVSMGKLQGAK